MGLDLEEELQEGTVLLEAPVVMVVAFQM